MNRVIRIRANLLWPKASRAVKFFSKFKSSKWMELAECASAETFIILPCLAASNFGSKSCDSKKCPKKKQQIIEVV